MLGDSTGVGWRLVKVCGFLVLYLVSAAATASAQTQSPGATRPNQPANSLPASTNATPVLADCAVSYPPIAVRLNLQGTTVLMLHVTAQGTVGDVRIKNSSGYDALDSTAVKCAQTWKFRPATQNGIPVEANVERAIRWSIAGGIPPEAIPFLPPAAPAGWEHDNTAMPMSGFLAAYKPSDAPTAGQYLSARTYPNVSGLNPFVVEVDDNLNRVRDLHVLDEGPIMLCSGDPASEIEYSQPGLVAGDPSRILDIQQIRTVKNGWAYVTSYIRPAESPKRTDAEQWIYGFCQAPGRVSGPDWPAGRPSK